MADRSSDTIRNDFLQRLGVNQEKKGQFCEQSLNKEDPVNLPILVRFTLKSRKLSPKERESKSIIRCILLSVLV